MAKEKDKSVVKIFTMRMKYLAVSDRDQMLAAAKGVSEK